MKIYIFADMEGSSGIAGNEFVVPDGTHYEEGREYFAMDVNACVEGCVQAGVDEILVADGHCAGNNLRWKDLHPAAELVRKGRLPRRFADIEGSDGIILLGYHAMAGVKGAVLEHTYSSSYVQNLWINGRLSGEFACDSLIAAEYGVPTIMVSGDDKICLEAKSIIPDIVTCQVKKGYSTHGARLTPMARAHALITEKTQEAIAKIPEIHRPKIEYPVTLRIETTERQNPKLTGCELIDARTAEFTSEDSFEKTFLACFG